MPVKIEDVKLAANGHWPRIITTLAGIPDDYLTTRHRDCPRCGGTKPWRVFDDFNQTGGAICTHCGQFADGIALVQWARKCSLFESIELIGAFLGVKGSTKKKKAATLEPFKFNKEQPQSTQQPQPGADDHDWRKSLEWIEPNEKQIALWCAKKKPITYDALKLVGARFARHRGFNVICIPIIGKDGIEVGYSLYNMTGNTLPFRRSKDDPIEELKVKVIKDKHVSGWMGIVHPGDGPIIKSEGPSDMLAILSINPSASVICNPSGAMEKPLPWMVETFKDRISYTIHDCDKPGQEGATEVINDNRSRLGWAHAIASVASESRNVVLPYPIEESHGKDSRDFIIDNLSLGFEPMQVYSQLMEVATSSPVIPKTEPVDVEIREAIDDPSRLAKINLARYFEQYGGTLKHWKDEWWRYKAGKYTRMSNSEVEAKIFESIRQEFERDYKQRIEAGEDVEAVKQVNITLLRNVMAATKSKCNLSSSVPQPCLLDDNSKATPDPQPHWLSVQNGILDLEAIFEGKETTEHLRPHDWKWFSQTQLKYKYDPLAKCPKWDEYLEQVMEGDGERIMLLQEWAGYLLTSTNYLQRFLAVQGEGGNGKSVYFAGIIAMLGTENVGHVSLENFGGRFELGTLVGKAANICGDVGEIDQVAEGNLKQFTGGDVMQFDRKNTSPISCRPTAKLMLSFNNFPKIKDRSRGMWRRMLLVPFQVKIESSKMVRHMDGADFWLKNGEAPGILNWAIQGLQRLRDQGDFTHSAAADEAIELYKRETNPALDFFDEFLEVSPSSQVPAMHLYELYSHWCRKQNQMPLGNRNFGAEIKRRYGDIRRRDTVGERKWYYRGLKISVDTIEGKRTEDEISNLY